MWGLVGNPEDRFSHNEAHIIKVLIPLLGSADELPLIVMVFTKSRLIHNVSHLRHRRRLHHRGAPWPSGTASDSRSGVRYLPQPCCVLEQKHIYSPKSTGNTQEVVAPSRHD